MELESQVWMRRVVELESVAGGRTLEDTVMGDDVLVEADIK